MFEIGDNTLDQYERIFNSLCNADAYIKKGDIFDTDNLILERDRISRYFRNRGFYSFNKDKNRTINY